MHRTDAPAGAALFDLDGTLVYSEYSVMGCLEAFASRERTIIPKQHFHRVFGIPMSDFLSVYYSPTELAQAVDRFQDLYLTEWIRHVVPIPQAASTLRRLQESSMPTCIVSANQHSVVRSILEVTGLGEFVQVYQGVEPERPDLASKVDVVACLLNRIEIQKKAPVLIGDTPSDGIAALRNGVPFWAVTYGHGKRSALKKLHPQYVFSDIKSVADKLVNPLT